MKANKTVCSAVAEKDTAQILSELLAAPQDESNYLFEVMDAAEASERAYRDILQANTQPAGPSATTNS